MDISTMQTKRAISSHFPTVSSFSRFFKRVTNETPKMYLQKEQK